MTPLLYGIGALLALVALRKICVRLDLSRAKHPSLRGHANMSKRVAKLVPFYEYTRDELFRADDAPAEIESSRREAFERLSTTMRDSKPISLERTKELEPGLADLQFTNAYRVPFQFRSVVQEHLPVGIFAEQTEGTRIRDLDGNWSYDLGGSYGVNVFGHDFYKGCIDRGVERARRLGPVLGPLHPIVLDNVARLREVSGLAEVSFHMSGTEAVMQAVRLARYHTGRSKAVRFCGAYHGWWDGVQPGVGNPRKVRDVYTLRDMHPNTAHVLRTRKDIACVLINSLQALHPNANAPGDAFLMSSKREAHFDREAYAEWLREVREICTDRGIVMIIDDVFLGFRIARGGSQEYFGVRGDLVTYGKTLGGGLPVGVVCGKHEFMKRYRDDRPSDICFARGTFNSHPYVMATMNEFLRAIDDPQIVADYETLDRVWNERATNLNSQLERAQLPVRVANMQSVWTTLYTTPSRYNWMLQFYLRAEGLSLSWVGTGRFILSHDYTDDEFADVTARFVRAAQAMHDDGWWWTAARLTNRSIHKRVLRELLSARLGRDKAAVRSPAG